MAPLVDQILKLRASQNYAEAPSQQYNSHIMTVCKLLKSNAMKNADLGDGSQPAGSNPLDKLSARLDTLPYLHILFTQISAHTNSLKATPPAFLKPPEGALWKKTAEFLTSFNPIEVRYNAGEFRRVLEFIIAVARTLSPQEAQSVTKLIARAMLRFDPSAGTLTSTHISFVRLCVERRTFTDAAQILDHEIHSFPTKDVPEDSENFYCSEFSLSNGYINTKSGITDKLTFHGIMEYYMLGAMTYIGLRQWNRAQYFLEHILSTPTTNVTTGPMLEAYRKWILVAIMAHGKASPLPRTLNPVVHRQSKSASRHYEAVAEAFKLSSAAKLVAEIQEAQPFFIQDGNMGLVQQVVDHHRDLTVIQLGETFDALPLSEISSLLSLSLEQTKEYLNSLMIGGKLNAKMETLQNGTDVLRFPRDLTSGPLAKSEAELHAELVLQTEKIKTLAQHVNEADRRLSLSKEFIEFTRKSLKTKSERELANAIDVQELQSDDENVMADVG